MWTPWDDQDEPEDEYEEIESTDYYRIDDFFVPSFPPAVYVYMRTPEHDDFKLVCAFGTVEAAGRLQNILEDYEGVEVRVVNVAEEN